MPPSSRLSPGAPAGVDALRTLQQPWQFRVVYREGRKIECKHAVVFYLRPRGVGNGLSFGFVASRRVGKAVRRNHAKRLLREAVRHTLRFFENESMWIVLVAKADLPDAGYHEILNDLQTKLRDEGLLISDTSS